MVLWGEVRGQSAFAKLAVLWVIKNRALKNFTTMKQEVLKPRQFSCLNAEDPNIGKLLIAYQLEPIPYVACETVFNLLPFARDPTGWADHYYNFKTAQPTWGRGHLEWRETVVIGDLVFGNAP